MTVGANSEPIEGLSPESLLVVIIDYITFGIDVATGLIIGISVIIALVAYIKTLRRTLKEDPSSSGMTIRFRLAGGLLLALDFAVGSDILKTILVPTVNELAMLSIIVALRIGLGWSLSKEISGHSEDLLTK